MNARRYLLILIVFTLLINIGACAPSITITNWDSDNETCNGLLYVNETNHGILWNITLLNTTTGYLYTLYDTTLHKTLLESIATSNGATFSSYLLNDSVYIIKEYNVSNSPSINLSQWNPSNNSCNGIITINGEWYNKTMNVVLLNITAGNTYRITGENGYPIYTYTKATEENATLQLYYPSNSIYWITEYPTSSNSWLLGVIATAFFAAGFGYLYKRNR